MPFPFNIVLPREPHSPICSYQALWNEESCLCDHKLSHVYFAQTGKLKSHTSSTSATGSTLVLGNAEKPTQMYTEQTPLFAMLSCLFGGNVDLLIIKFHHVANTLDHKVSVIECNSGKTLLSHLVLHLPVLWAAFLPFEF